MLFRSDDWDYISRITRDPSWAWDAMARHRDLNQKYVAPSDGHDDVRQERASPLLLYSYRSSQTNQYLPSAHSRNGTLSVSLPGYTYPGDSRVIAAAAEPDFVSEFPFQRDANAGNSVRLITIASFGLFYQPSFPKTDRRWLGAGHHCQRQALQFGNQLRWTGIHQSPESTHLASRPRYETS